MVVLIFSIVHPFQNNFHHHFHHQFHQSSHHPEQKQAATSLATATHSTLVPFRQINRYGWSEMDVSNVYDINWKRWSWWHWKLWWWCTLKKATVSWSCVPIIPCNHVVMTFFVVEKFDYNYTLHDVHRPHCHAKSPRSSTCLFLSCKII